LAKNIQDYEIMLGELILYITKFMSTHYRVKHRCSKLLHYAELFSN